jgi:lipid A ethanolaminephosphotransferase
MLGNHGPAYYQRYPEEFRRFTPTCDTTDLASCSRVALINTYDNAILYTDHVLAKLIADLKGITTHDTGMLYVSDHGESLGENNLYLHGIPHVFAPREQTHVPMIMWISPDFMADQQLDGACLDRLASTQAVSHDYLIHTLLQLFDIQTMSYEPALDLTATCTAQPLQDLSQI